MNTGRSLIFDKVNGFNRAYWKDGNMWNEPGPLHIPIRGYNAAVGSSFETLWDFSTTRVMLAIAAQTTLGVSSGSANDTAAGTGTRTIRVWGINENYELISEDFTMNGQTRVVGTKTFFRVFRMVQLTAGSGGTNAGIIYAYTSSVSPTAGVPASGIHDTMTVGESQSASGLFTVPAGKTLALLGIYGGNTAGVARIRVRDTDIVGVKTETRTTVATAAASGFWVDFGVPILIPEKHDVYLDSLSASASIQDVTLNGVLF